MLVQSKVIVCLLLINFIILMFIPVQSLASKEIWWDDDWKFRQEIYVPIDTGTNLAKYQPIDTHIEFTHSCWAFNDNQHSIRVILQDGEKIDELDSQIYDLEYLDDSHIQSCNLVFLIPEEANGKERYFVYYDDSEKPVTNYPDHVSVEESYYIYEPISGYPFESHFFKIIEDEYIVYAISQKGQFMGYKSSQYVTKLKKNTQEVLPKNGDIVASFDFRYYYGQEYEDYSSTSQHLISKEIITDGNLMVEVRIVSKSKKDDIQTHAIYKYYYCPTENKRIQVHVKHETLQELQVSDNVNTDGIFARLQCGGISSNSIKDLNFGEILPYLHLYNERDMISEYSLDLDPEYIPDDYDIRVLSNKDDIDLGNKAWASFDEGKSGLSHSLILSTNNVLKSGHGEKDGVQVNAYEMDYPHLPGLESNIASFEFGRNSYEADGVQDLVIPKDFIVEFDAEVFSSSTGGFSIIQEEADIFQSLVDMKPAYDHNVSDESEETKDNKLTIFVHNAHAIPMGAGLAALTGRNFGYITTELYRYKELIGSGTPERLSLKHIPTITNKTIRERIKTLTSSFDWKNLSFFKKFTFQNLEQGSYLVKIYKENPLLGNKRKYIGFKTIEVKEDTKTHVFCRSEGSIHISVFDNNNEGLEDAEVYLLKDDFVISNNKTDSKGQTLIKAPCNKYNSYDLKILYNGFIIYEDRIKLGPIRRITPIKRSIKIERFDFDLEVVDTWKLPLEIEATPSLNSNEMDVPITITPNKLSNGKYLFTNLISSTYKLSLNYKSFSTEEQIQIPEDKKINLVFPVEFNIKIKTLDSRGIPLNNAKLIVSRGSVDLKERSDISNLYLPPGVYNIDVFTQDELIGSRKINVFGERSFDIITVQEPFYPLIVTFFVIIFTSSSLIFTYLKKNMLYFLKTLSISLVIAALVFPWWMLYGSTSQVETSTKMYLIPSELVTISTTNEIIAGELSFLPNIFLDFVLLILILTTIGCILIILSLFLKKFNSKIYFLSLIVAFVAFTSALAVFTLSMSSLTEVGVGSFVDSGNIDVYIPGEETIQTIFCSWGPTYGFYFYFISILTLFFTIILIMKKNLKITIFKK